MEEIVLSSVLGVVVLIMGALNMLLVTHRQYHQNKARELRLEIDELNITIRRLKMEILLTS